MEKAIYYDETYPAPWLGKHQDTLKKQLESLQEDGFKRIDAVQLQSWMREQINDGKTYESSVIFFRDAIPDTIFPEGVDSANILFRKYLDEGGRVVWFGDIPLWYRAIKIVGANDGLDNRWLYNIPLAVLGLQPLVADSSTLCEWVGGLKNEMKYRWYSMRPVYAQNQRNFQGIEVKPLAYASVTLMPNQFNMSAILRWKKAGKKITGVSGQVGTQPIALGAGLSFQEKFPKELGTPQRLACAWHAIFNRNYRSQGLYRFIDSQISEIDQDIIHDAKLLATISSPA
ncbi:hypothetical protein ACFLTL_00915 [Chloroflexota bacterium]